MDQPTEPSTQEALEVSFAFSAVILRTSLEVNVLGTGVTGSGSSWGVGFGGYSGIGLLNTKGDSLKSFASRVTTFVVVSGGSGGGFASVDFKDGNGNFIGLLTGLGAGIGGAIGINGDFRFR